MKRLEYVQGNNKEQLKVIKDQGEKQAKVLSQNKIKARLLQSMRIQKIKKTSGY